MLPLGGTELNYMHDLSVLFLTMWKITYHHKELLMLKIQGENFKNSIVMESITALLLDWYNR